METLGDRIKRARKLQKLSQSEFAKVLGISQGTLSDLEQNKNKPSLETTISLNRAFKELNESFTDISLLNKKLNPLPLSKNEERLLLLFRKLSQSAQNEIISFVEFKNY